MDEIDLNTRSIGKVIIFKGDDSTISKSDPFVVELDNLSLESELIPALKFTFQNLDDLKNKLYSPDSFSGIIFSSPRCVEALEKCGSLSGWTNHIFFAVGSKTASLVRKLGFEPLGEDCGNAVALADFILRDYSDLEHPLLLPHGNLSLQTLNERLTCGGMQVEMIEVYSTVSNPRLEDSIREYFQSHSRVDFVVYMSPSAITSSLHLLKKFQDFSLIKFVCLGPTTAGCLEANGIKPAGVAEKPTPQHLANVISKIISSEKIS